MSNLTKNQKDFLLNVFFKNEKYAGWRSIAESLVTNGKCLAAGSRSIWRGGVGNFIETKQSDEAIGCVNYTFDLDTFLTSKYFKEVVSHHVLDLDEKREKMTDDLCKAIDNLKEIKELA